MRRLLVVSAAVAAVLTAACGAQAATGRGPSRPVVSSPAGSRQLPVAPTPTPPRLPLAGKVVVIDPGHNPGDASHPAEVNRLVNVVTGTKPCDAVGASTDAGYPESYFTYDVATRAAAILRARGATVVLTRSASTPWGPCVTERAAIGNRAHADAAISIHADGGPASGVGFQVIEPGPVGPNDGMIAASKVLGAAVHDTFHRETGEPYATYLGSGSGYTTRTDLGGLNLSTVPKVFVECANMRNAADAARVTSAVWRQQAATAIADGLTTYLR